jgi:hypothetical protein
MCTVIEFNKIGSQKSGYKQHVDLNLKLSIFLKAKLTSVPEKALVGF